MAVNIYLGFVAVASGADTITATYTPAPPSLYDGLILWFRAAGANTVTNPTFSPNGLTARTIFKNGGTALAAGDIPAAGAIVGVVYDLTNTRWVISQVLTDSFWKAGAGAGALMDKRSADGSGEGGTTIGNGAVNTSETGISFGEGAINNGIAGFALGVAAENTADYGKAIGHNSKNRIAKSTNISGAIVTRKDNGETDEYQYFSGAEVPILSQVIDLTQSEAIQIDLPTGVKMFVNEVGLIVTDGNTVTVQPTVNFGTVFPSTQVNGLTAAGKRFKAIVASEGQTQLILEVTGVATATTLTARAYWKGFIVENQ